MQRPVPARTCRRTQQAGPELDLTRSTTATRHSARWQAQCKRRLGASNLRSTSGVRGKLSGKTESYSSSRALCSSRHPRAIAPAHPARTSRWHPFPRPWHPPPSHGGASCKSITRLSLRIRWWEHTRRIARCRQQKFTPRIPQTLRNCSMILLGENIAAVPFQNRNFPR